MVAQEWKQNPESKVAAQERGQSIVLLALLFVGMVAFVGLALDAGMIFARTAQFTSAVDAAALAGVVDLSQGGLDAAIDRANQFLNANGWPITGTISIQGAEVQNSLGIPEFAYTVTWPIETSFIRLVGIETINVTGSATAAFHARTDMPAPTQTSNGMASLAGQFIFGQNACTVYGDPVSPIFAGPGAPNPNYDLYNGRYLYRIRISEDYANNPAFNNTLRVQLFDADSSNGNTGEPPVGSCGTGNGEPCYGATGDSRNPVYLHRVDKVYAGSNCAEPAPGNQNGNTITRWEIYYLLEDGTKSEVAAYQSSLDNVSELDMLWVTPGVTPGIGYEWGQWDLNLTNVPADEFGHRHFYVEVLTTAGSSMNGWDIWAGPVSIASQLSADVNARNAQLATQPGLFFDGVQVFAVGRLPLNWYRGNEQVTVPVAAVDPVQTGGTIYASTFDFDSGAFGPLVFTFDTLATVDFQVSAGAICSGSSNCNNQWVKPQVRMGIPTYPQVAFFGGYLEATYTPNYDQHTWAVYLTDGRPFLTK